MFRRPESDDDDDYYSSKPSGAKPLPSEDDLMTSTLKNVMDGSDDQRKKDSESKNESESAPTPMSHDEMNALAAKIIKAEVSGNMEKVAKLKAKLEKAKAQAAGSEFQSKSQTKTVLVGVSKLHKKRQQALEASEMLSNKFEAGDGTVKRSTKDERRKRYRGEDEIEKQGKDRKKHGKYERSNASCDGCYASKDNGTLVYDSGKVVVSVTKRNILEGNHFYILPKEHYVSTVDLEDDVYEEITKIKNAFIELYSKQNKSILFFEVNKNEKHMTIGGIPLETNAVTNSRRLLQNSFDLNAEEGASSSFFKDLSDIPGGLRRFLRPGISYTWFGFNNEKGFAYRLNDPEDFSDDFYYVSLIFFKDTVANVKNFSQPFVLKLMMILMICNFE
jgi:hypothetical protein